MNVKNILPVLAAVLCLSALGKSNPPSGAKEVFFDEESRTASRAGAARVDREAERGVDRELASGAVLHDATGRRLSRARGETGRPRVLGLSYWIELVSPEHAVGKQVTDARTFRNGERIRLHFRSNAVGHIALVLLGTSGTSKLLFPDRLKGLARNVVPPNEDHIPPSERHWFTFDQDPGTERLLVLFARTQEELEKTFPTSRTMDAEETAELLKYLDRTRGSKDLLIESETEKPDELGVYGVSMEGQPLMLEIRLRHQL
jgi:hypothetical protein